MDKITQLFLDEFPPDIMATPEGSRLMYDCILNYLYHLVIAVGSTQKDLERHIKFVFELKDEERLVKLN